MDEQGCSRLLADTNGRILDRLAGLEKIITPQIAQQPLSPTFHYQLSESQRLSV